MSEAAACLGCTPQSVRDWIRDKQLRARKVQGRWRVSEPSVRTHPRFREPTTDDTQARLTTLEAQIRALQSEQASAREQVELLRRERDEYRAQARRAQEQALLLSATVKDLEQAARSLLDGLSSQSEAIAQSLVPDTPADLQN